MIIKMMMTIMINGEDSYKIPMMADDEVLVVVCMAPTAKQGNYDQDDDDDDDKW